MPGSSVVESLSSEERELWDQACRLWEQSRAGDRAGLWAAIHPGYVGWDMSTDLPHGKEAAVASVTGGAPALNQYELQPHSVRIYDNVVGVVHYSYRATVGAVGGAPLEVTGKWTEVYLRNRNEWTMISVSGIPKPSPHEEPVAMPDAKPFIWHELVTPDQESSGNFFRQLFRWTSREVDAGPFGTYTLFQKDGQDVAGMMNPTAENAGGASYWHTYIAVDDVDECARCAPALGGSVLVPPHDVPEFGRVCAIADPKGAVAHLVQPRGR